ncbi:hypothetical protein Taro_052556 [Colocasia esculenta]|uniref:protein-disulfide reductase n=1 Tax=Colocasia esculenta TaxID=4460 RepID=A0A843XIZ3_COLES|nr:hypothetical protein [Colocasia esculenta]
MRRGKKTIQEEGQVEDGVEKDDTSIVSLLSSAHTDYLLSPSGGQVKASELQGKVVGLYFSANWYMPCHEFTQLLKGVYDQLVRSGAGFEVVFVSFDEDSDAFRRYYASMPWLAIPFSELESKKALSNKFQIEGMPALVLLQAKDGEVLVEEDGVELIYKYGAGAFPFTRERIDWLGKEEREKYDLQTITDLLTSSSRDFLLAASGKQVPVSSLQGKTVGLYFSARWCSPCLKFTPKLISVYANIKEMLLPKEDEDLEVVFVSTDRDQVAFESYFSTMPWLALPFGDPGSRELTKYFDIRSIPCLVILGPDGRTLTKEGRSLVNLHLDKAYPFTQSRIEDLEKQLDEEAKALPTTQTHGRHLHELNLVSQGSGGGPYICCECEEQGSRWAYQCLQCGYEVHPGCAI